MESYKLRMTGEEVQKMLNLMPVPSKVGAGKVPVVTPDGSDYELKERDGIQSVNGQTPDEKGNIVIDTGVQTVNGQKPNDDGNTEIDVGVQSVNGQTPDESGNVNIDIPDAVLTVNGNLPDEDGNVNIDIPEVPDAVLSVNGKTPDENGNVEIDSVASWNDIPDRPFGEVTGMVEILPETTVDMPEGMGFLDGGVSVDVGSTYTVKWNGTEYECVAQTIEVDGDTLAALGDVGAASGGTSTGEPFVIVFYSDGVSSATIMPMDGSTSVTISIRQEQTVIKPLPTKYLPDGVPYCIDGDKVEVLAECQPTYDEGSGIFLLMDAIDIAPGETYMVQWNGLEYSCVAQEIVGEGLTSAVLGDLGALDGAPTTGEPFIIVAYPPEVVASEGLGGMILALDNTPELTLAIYGGGTEIRKLDNRCLDLAWLPITKPSGTKEVLAETTFTSSSGNYNTLKTPLGITAGERYIVNFNGVEYERVASTVPIETGYEFVKTTLGHAFDPFTITEIDEATAAALSLPFRVQIQQRVSTETFDYTISVKGYENVPNKLPEEFLPESVDGVIIRSSTEGSAKKFKLTVDDSGAITATEVTA